MPNNLEDLLMFKMPDKNKDRKKNKMEFPVNVSVSVNPVFYECCRCNKTNSHCFITDEEELEEE